MIFSNFFNTKGRMLTILWFGSLRWFNFSIFQKLVLGQKVLMYLEVFFMNWAKNCKVPIWFRRKNKNFRDFRVFDFALYPRSKTWKSRKFRLPRIMTLIVIQDLKSPKKSIETKTKRFQYDLELYPKSKSRKLIFNSNFDSLKSKRMRYDSRRKKQIALLL